jgi:hypothetical protein
MACVVGCKRITMGEKVPVLSNILITNRFHKDNLIWASLWFDNHKPVMSVFLKLFVQQLNKLSETGTTVFDTTHCTIGITVRHEGVDHKVNVHLILGTFDTIAKGEVQGIKQHNSTSAEGGGCTVCKHPGVRIETKTCYPYQPIPSEKKTQKEIIDAFTQGTKSKDAYYKHFSPLILVKGFDIFEDNGKATLVCLLIIH